MAKRNIILLLMMLLTGASYAADDQQWMLVEPESGQSVLMDNVGFLIASDYESTFSVVCLDGAVVSGCAEVTFKQGDASSIAVVRGDGTMPSIGYVNDAITISGLQAGGAVAVYDAAGMEVVQSTTVQGSATISVSGLPTGVYIVKAGAASIKFLKK